MRNLTALLFLLSLCSLHLVSSAPPSFDYMSSCCSGVSKAKVPLRNIVTYWKTKKGCPMEAIVFETLNKRKETNYRCVDPTAPWLNRHMEAVDRRNDLFQQQIPESQR